MSNAVSAPFFMSTSNHARSRVATQTAIIHADVVRHEADATSSTTAA